MKDVDILLSTRNDGNTLRSIDCLSYILSNPVHSLSTFSSSNYKDKVSIVLLEISAKKYFASFDVHLAASKTFLAHHNHLSPLSPAHPPAHLTFRPSSHAYIQNFGVVRTLALIHVFASAFGHALVITDDAEIHETGNPLPLHHTRRVINLLKKLVMKSCKDRAKQYALPPHPFGDSLNFHNASVLNDLSSRHSRKPLGSTSLWTFENDDISTLLKRCKHHNDFTSLLNLPVLKTMPYAVPLKTRLKLFESIVKSNRVAIQGSNENQNLQQGINVSITRGMVLEDGMRYLNALGERMKQRIIVSYRNEAGVSERGIDVGGLFKEFWGDLSALAFSPNYALFCAIGGSGSGDGGGGSGNDGGGGELFPNPGCFAAHGEDAVTLYNFLGKILGKALFEGITIQPVFAHFFLAFIKGNYNYMHILPDLATKDPQLYNNLMFLKTYEGDAEDLCLTFSVNDDDFGSGVEVELIR